MQVTIDNEPQETRLTNKSSAHILGDVSDLIKSLRSFATREAEWHRVFALCAYVALLASSGRLPRFPNAPVNRAPNLNYEFNFPSRRSKMECVGVL